MTAAGALPAQAPLPLARGSVNKAAWLPAGPAQPLKGKRNPGFSEPPASATRLAETITRLRSGWPPRGPGSFQTWAPVLKQEAGPGEG